MAKIEITHEGEDYIKVEVDGEEHEVSKGKEVIKELVAEREGKALVEFEEVDDNELYLHQHLGDGSLGDTKFDADIILPSYGLVVKVDGKRYRVSSQNIISAVIEAHLARR